VIPKSLDTLTAADIEGLVASKEEEGPTLDFKRDLPGDDRDARKEFVADVCAFANTQGGDLVYGIAESSEGLAQAAVPHHFNPDEVITRLTNVLTDGIEPRLHGVLMAAVEMRDGAGRVLVVRVPRSHSGVHRSLRDAHFWVRESRSKRQLDVPGITSRLRSLMDREDRVAEFFAGRYASVMVGTYALPLVPGPKLVVHLLPAHGFLNGEDIALDLPKNSRMPLLGDESSPSEKRVFDGRIFYTEYQRAAATSTLAMHSGVVEAVQALIPPGADLGESIPLAYVEDSVIHFLSEMIGLNFTEATCGFPFIVRVALVGANGMKAVSGLRNDYYRAHGVQVVQHAPALVLPEALVESPSADVIATLHRTLDRMWHAWGYKQSLTYTNKDGVWVRAT
jgi:hypothetical protein